MTNQLTSNAEALRLFFTEDIFLVKDNVQNASVAPVMISANFTDKEIIVAPKVEVETKVVLPTSVPVIEEPKANYSKEWNFEFLGKNQKHILILVNDAANKVSSPQGTELLRKLVKAIELTNNDFALVNYANYDGATFEDLNQVFSCQLLLSFGVNTDKLGLPEQPLHEITELNKTRLIFTTNLHDLDSDQMSKKTLWATLQKLDK
jgi:hypothetical protein